MSTLDELYNEFRETTDSSTDIFKGRVLHVVKDDITLPNGRKSVREVIRHKGAVCVVPVTDDGKVVIVKQYRYPFDRVLVEIPAGKLDSADEIPLDAAKRELKEETGAVADSIVYLGEYYGSPAILDEKIYMYLARGLHFGEQKLDEDEFVETESISMEKLCSMILRGEVPDGKTQAAVLRAAVMLGKTPCADKA